MNRSIRIHLLLCALLMVVFLTPALVQAATLRVSPSTGVYTAGKTFTISVLLNTGGVSVNASDGELSFNTKELQVISVSRASSIFNLWTEEPTFSNISGTLSFGGGSPS